jgi:hypothetical protein
MTIGNNNNPHNIRQRAPIGGNAGQRMPAQQQPRQAGPIQAQGRPAGGPIQGQPGRGGPIQAQSRQPQGQTQRGPGQHQQAARPAGGIQGYDAIRNQSQRQTQIERQRAQERADGYQPLRFYLPDPQPKNKPWPAPEELEANIVILDEAPSFACYEHAFPDPRTGRMGKGSYTQLCLSQEGHCPACDADTKDPYFALFLSIIDLRGYVNKDNVFVPHSKKLLVVKNKNQEWFFRKYDQNGTLRGMQLLMVRNDPRGANHGNPDFVTIHPEEAILESFGHDPVYYTQGEKQGQIAKEANSDCYAYDYASIFPRPDYEIMLQKYGGAPAAGSSFDQQSVWGRDAGQFQQTQSRAGAGGNRIGLASAAQRGSNQMQGGDYDQGYDDDGSAEDQEVAGDYQADSRGGQGGTFSREIDDDIPFERGSLAPTGGRSRTPMTAGAAATDPSEIPL